MSLSRLMLIASIFCLMSIKPAFVWGQENVKIPSLNGHQFINNRIVQQPFIKSSFDVNLGVGSSARLNLPSVEIGDTSITPVAGKLVYANLGFQADVLLQEWVSYSLQVGVSARVGVDASSLYTNGLNTIVGAINSWKIRLFHNDKHYLTTLLGIRTYQASVINVSNFIDDIINGINNSGLAQNINVLQGSVGLSYAYAPGSVVGFQMMGQFIYGDQFEPGKSGTTGFITGGIDVNLYPKTSIPVGFSAAYGYSSIPDYTAAQYNVTSLYNGKIAYTGSDEFIISADLTSFKAPYLVGKIAQQSDVDTQVINYSLNVLIYFK